jgi:hypothetical protein
VIKKSATPGATLTVCLARASTNPMAHATDELVEGLPRPEFIDVLGSELAFAATTLAPTIGVTARPSPASGAATPTWSPTPT